jgi:hypothetical protein
MTIDENDRPLRPGDAVTLTSGDSFNFAGPFAGRVVTASSIVGGKATVLIEITDVPNVGLTSGSPQRGNRFWLIAKAGLESLDRLGDHRAMSVHIAETQKEPGEVLFPDDFRVKAWGEVRRVADPSSEAAASRQQ